MTNSKTLLAIDFYEIHNLLPPSMDCGLEDNETLVVASRHICGAILFRMRHGNWTSCYSLGCAVSVETVEQALQATRIIDKFLMTLEFQKAPVSQ